MHDIVTTPIERPFAWRASDFKSLDEIAIELTAGQRRSLAEMARAARSDGRAWSGLTRDEEALPELAATLAEVRREVYEGRGLVLLRGLPMAELDEDEAAIAAWAVGMPFRAESHPERTGRQAGPRGGRPEPAAGLAGLPQLQPLALP